MSAWLVVMLVVGLGTAMALAAFAIWLVRHVQLLGRTAARLSDELSPLADDIARGSSRASERAAQLRMPTRRERRRGRR